MVKTDILSSMLETIPQSVDNIAYACMGTDRVIGDSLGPIVGSMLASNGLNVYGTIEDPMHALTIRKQFAKENHETYDSQVSETLNNLAGLYSKMGESHLIQNEHNEAIAFFEKSEDYYSEIRHVLIDKNTRLSLYNNIVKAYREIGNYAKAAEYNKKSFYLLLNE